MKRRQARKIARNYGRRRCQYRLGTVLAAMRRLRLGMWGFSCIFWERKKR